MYQVSVDDERWNELTTPNGIPKYYITLKLILVQDTVLAERALVRIVLSRSASLFQTG